MTKIQQDVLIYKEKTFTTAQKQFEKDLRKRQGEGWRLVSVTPTERKGFGRIVQLTAIYERDVIESSEIPVSEPHPIKANEDTILTQEVENSTKENGGMWEKLKESNRRAIEREHAYQSTLNPEQLRKRKRRNLLISSITLLVALTLCIGVVWAAASNPDSQSIDNTANTSTTVIQTVKPTTTPKPTNTPTATPKPAPTETAAQQETEYRMCCLFLFVYVRLGVHSQSGVACECVSYYLSTSCS